MMLFKLKFLLNSFDVQLILLTSLVVLTVYEAETCGLCGDSGHQATEFYKSKP